MKWKLQNATVSKTVRAAASKICDFQTACLDAVVPVKKLLTDIAVRLELKELITFGLLYFPLIHNSP